MFELFYMGGPLFMGILTLIFLAALILAVRAKMKFTGGDWDMSATRRNLSYVKSIGILAFIVGIFGQLIGLYGAFVAIEEMGQVSPAMLAGGLKVSMITTLYGSLIFIVSFLIWVILDSTLKDKGAE